ncbi:MAG TPA: ATP synthase F1 subunit gamma [Cytophagales bacterium]|nr:ATP synthase F1 subunit gamma [Cytophagales bacterium]HAA18519.1 ATP synthase F1 subunit gamma [Cytophagales bacterium]HAP60158.1 ATP synthase F1 subunit gamma [Cytophagales bacterium]
MANLKEVKSRITSVISTQQITKAMKMVAAAKLRRAQDRITQMRPYADKLTSILSNVTGASESFESVYAEQRDVKKVLIVVVSSDRGLCGPFNTNVFRKVRARLVDTYAQQLEAGNVTFLPVGKKASDFVKRQGYANVVMEYAGLFQNLKFEEVREAAEYAMDQFEAGAYDYVEVVYNEFVSVSTQVVQAEQFLPIKPAESEEETSFSVDYIFEPSQEYIAQELIPTTLKMQFFKALLDSNASEQGARMLAMDAATENASELLRELRLAYNRTRQAAITTEILEIVAGANALDEG